MIKYNYIGGLKLWQTEKSLQTKTNDRRKKKHHSGIVAGV